MGEREDDDEPFGVCEVFWVCENCGWEGDPDKVGSRCPGCNREIGDDEP